MFQWKADLSGESKGERSASGHQSLLLCEGKYHPPGLQDSPWELQKNCSEVSTGAVAAGTGSSALS